VAVPPAPPHHAVIRTTAGLGVLIAAILIAVAFPSPALADPTPAQLKAQIAAQNKALEPIIEQYNGVRVKLASDKAKAKQIAAQIGPEQLKASVAKGRLDDIARTVYQAGPATPLQALFATKSTDDLIDVLGAMNEIARQQHDEVSNASGLVTTYQSQQAELTTLIETENQQYSKLASQKTDIQAKVDHLQQLLDEANAAAAAKAASASSSGGGSTSSKYTKSQLMPVACPYTSSSGKGHTAAVKACSLVWDTSHSPPWRMYGWADAGPDTYDWSGLTMKAWAAAGISLDHYTGSQWTESYAISESSLRPGDLVFYFASHSHVALYVGGGWIVQAEETGQPLKMSHMTFESPRYYRRVNGT
jgi:peptidoglycan DL-endopeptidase CwlO